jgi:hypothetical protein
MEAALADPGLPPGQAAHLHFALGRARLDAAEAEPAMAHFHRANALRRAQVPFDSAAHEAFVAGTIATCTPAFLAARADWGDPREGPVFLVGLPRSAPRWSSRSWPATRRWRGFPNSPISLCWRGNGPAA